MGGVVATVYASLFSAEVQSLILICPGMATSPEESPFYRKLSSPDEEKMQAVKNYLIPETKDEMKFFLKASVKNKSLLSMPDAHLVAYLEKRKEQNGAFWHMWEILNVNVSKRALVPALRCVFVNMNERA